MMYMSPFPLLNNYGVCYNTTKQHSLHKPSNARVKMNTHTLLRFKDKHTLEHCNRVLRSFAIRYYVLCILTSFRVLSAPESWSKHVPPQGVDQLLHIDQL